MRAFQLTCASPAEFIRQALPGGQSRRAPHPPATNAVIGLIHRRYLRAICVPRCQSGGRRACLPGRAPFEVDLLAGDADLGQRQHCFCPPTQIRQRPRRQKLSDARWLLKGWSSREAAAIASAPLLIIACLLSRRRLPTLHTAQSLQTRRWFGCGIRHLNGFV
jgi:hypothetical protein